MKTWLSALGACAAVGLALGAAVQAAAQRWETAQGMQLPIADFDKLPPMTTGSNRPQYDHSGVYNKPFYNPETKSYFENYSATNGKYDIEHRYNWEAAQRVAETRTYHGVRGRLAVIKTKETNDFIVKNLKPEDGTWFGLQYFCDLHALRWVTGEFWPLKAYQNWFRPWNVEGTNPRNQERAGCLSDKRWMGVHYWGKNAGYKWNANGTAKEFWLMIVEYPTGKP